MYKAKNVDTDKALEALSEARRFQESEANLEIEKKRAYLSGVYKGLDIGESIFECSNYEKEEEPSYVDGVIDFIYELGKELDIQTQDIRDNFASIDEACSILSDRIRNRIEEDHAELN